MKYISLISIIITAFLTFTACEEKPNNSPVIESIYTAYAEDTLVAPGDTVFLRCSAEDPDDPKHKLLLGYYWNAPDGGEFIILAPASFNEKHWQAPIDTGEYRISCTVTDNDGATDSDTLSIEVIEE
jgi:hypothetical protein